MTGPAELSVAAAARAMGLSTATVRRDVARGAPAVRRGTVGRGHGALIDLAQYRRWRAREFDAGHTMALIATALGDVLKRDAGEGVPAHVMLGVRRQQAAALLCVAWERIHRAVAGREASELPPEIANAVRDLSGWRS